MRQVKLGVGLAWLTVVGCSFLPALATKAQTQGEMNRTAGKQYVEADRQMNAAYGKMMRVLSPEQQKQLKTAQLAWLKFRDVEATWRASKAKGGSIYPMIYATHLEEITRARTRDLEKAYKQFTTEGDM